MVTAGELPSMRGSQLDDSSPTLRRVRFQSAKEVAKRWWLPARSFSRFSPGGYVGLVYAGTRRLPIRFSLEFKSPA